MIDLENCREAFKAYDLRGEVPQQLNAELAYRIGNVFAKMFDANKVIVGRDIRLSGSELSVALIKGLTDAGCNVIDIGLCGTEMVYFATTFLQAEGGIMITASHNPKEYNGMKFVSKGSKPISSDTGLFQLADAVLVENFKKTVVQNKGKLVTEDLMQSYVNNLLTFIDVSSFKKLRIVVNPGNGAAGMVLDEFEKKLPIEFIRLNNNPDGTFPNGVPNPLLTGNREQTASIVRKEKANFGIAWDGDYDRCFLFDEKGQFIEGYYIVGLLAESFLAKNPGEKIIHDPRLVWNTQEIVNNMQGETVECKSGHAFIKEKMREVNAIYGGEMSAHHYFRDFTYCDSGMLPWLLIAELLSNSGFDLSQLVSARIEKFPCSGEINRCVDDAKRVLLIIKEKYEKNGKVDYLDGVSVDLGNWRFNVRISNTEPVVRLNVETRGDKNLLEEKTREVLSLIGGYQLNM